MEVYYHKTDGGAEYLSVNPEGREFFNGVFARIDGKSMEVYLETLRKHDINSVTVY